MRTVCFRCLFDVCGYWLGLLADISLVLRLCLICGLYVRWFDWKCTWCLGLLLFGCFNLDYFRVVCGVCFGFWLFMFVYWLAYVFWVWCFLCVGLIVVSCVCYSWLVNVCCLWLSFVDYCCVLAFVVPGGGWFGVACLWIVLVVSWICFGLWLLVHIISNAGLLCFYWVLTFLIFVVLGGIVWCVTLLV